MKLLIQFRLLEAAMRLVEAAPLVLAMMPLPPHFSVSWLHVFRVQSLVAPAVSMGQKMYENKVPLISDVSFFAMGIFSSNLVKSASPNSSAF